MSRTFRIWGLLSATIAVCSFALLITVGWLSSELGWLYFSGVDFKPSNYLVYYIEQVLGWILLASVVSAVIWFVAIMIKMLKEEIRGKSQ
jgi:TRAP-type C4-dicarboxylate transport system permease small subunit